MNNDVIEEYKARTYVYYHDYEFRLWNLITNYIYERIGIGEKNVIDQQMLRSDIDYLDFIKGVLPYRTIVR